MQAWIAGETLPRTFTLLADGEPIDLTSCTVELLLTDVNGAPVPTTGDLAITDAAAGEVTYSPDATDLTVAASPLSALFKITNALLQVGYSPSTGADLWIVSDGLTATPALTFADLRKRVLRWLDAMEDYETGNVLDELVKQQLNDALEARCNEYPWPWMRGYTQLTVAPGTRIYQLPANCARLLFVYSATDQRHCTYVPDRMWQDADLRLDGAATSGYLYQPYTVEGTCLRFLEPPRQGETLTLGYFRMPQVMVNTQDLPDLPYPHGRLLVWDTLLDLKSYAKDLDAVSLWTRQQEKAERNLYAAFQEGQILGSMPLLVHRSPSA